MNEPTWYPVLPLKNTVVFPHLVVPLAVGRSRSTAAVEAALAQDGEDKHLVCVAQLDPDEDAPNRAQLRDIGTLVVIRRIDRGENGTQVVVQGVGRVQLLEARQEDPFLQVQCVALPELSAEGAEVDALARENLALGARIANTMDPNNGMQVFRQLIEALRGPLLQSYRMASLANLDLERQQQVLAADTGPALLRVLHDILVHEAKVSDIRKEIASQAANDIEKVQREHMLRQQKRAIEQALGDENGELSDAAELRERLKNLELPDAIRTEAERECKRLERMSPNAADFQIARAYLELILELPWHARTEDSLDLANARTVLDEDHFGLDDVKERILEFLAVMKLNPTAKAPLCGYRYKRTKPGCPHVWIAQMRNPVVAHENTARTGAWSDGSLPLRSSRSTDAAVQRAASGGVTRM